MAIGFFYSFYYILYNIYIYYSNTPLAMLPISIHTITALLYPPTPEPTYISSNLYRLSKIKHLTHYIFDINDYIFMKIKMCFDFLIDFTTHYASI